MFRSGLLCFTMIAAAGVSAARAQVPPPAAEPGSVPETQAAPPSSPPPPRSSSRPAGPVRISGGVIAGLRLGGDPPVYPPDAKAQGISGTVVMHAVINREGQVENLTVVSGSPLLADAAVTAVRSWTYRPYLLNGEPTEVDTTITVNFNLSPTPAERPAGYGTVRELSPSSSGRVRVSSGVMAGLRVFGPSPSIPPGVSTSGGVVLRAIIARDGSIQSLEAVHGSPELVAAVIQSVQRWKYKPYLLNGHPVEVDTTLSMVW